MSELAWVEKYRPSTTAQVLGNEDARVTVYKWLKKWKPGAKAVLLYGPPGVGKTTLVRTVAKDLSHRIIEMNASDTRTEKSILKIAAPAAKEASLDKIFSGYKGTLVLMDEVDGILGREDIGGVGAILTIIKETNSPVILTANDIDDLKLRDLRDACQTIRIHEIRAPLMVFCLRRICEEEGINADPDALRLIALKSRGDLRSAINDLQSFGEGKRKLTLVDVKHLSLRDRKTDLNETLTVFFNAKSLTEAKQALSNSTIKPFDDTLILTIHDNLPLRFKDARKLAKAYCLLSDADLIKGRIKRSQNWGLLGYELELIAGIATLANGEPSIEKFRFPPEKILRMARTRSVRDARSKTCAKIGNRCHVSRKRAASTFLPFIKLMISRDKQQAEKIASWFDFDEDLIQTLWG